jgi:hypothetical protein
MAKTKGERRRGGRHHSCPSHKKRDGHHPPAPTDDLPAPGEKPPLSTLILIPTTNGISLGASYFMQSWPDTIKTWLALVAIVVGTASSAYLLTSFLRPRIAKRRNRLRRREAKEIAKALAKESTKARKPKATAKP